jgi:hypothetical protein
MKAKLTFNLPEDQSDFNFATQGSDWWMVVWEIDQWLRAQTKYANDDMSEDTYQAYKECREQLTEFINRRNLNLEQ